jgi:hypothetical protein
VRKNDFIFTQSSIFHLQKLAKNVHGSTGQRHKLADQNSMLKLLKTAVLSNDSMVKGDLSNFKKGLNDKQIDTFLRHGVILSQVDNKVA